MEAFFVATQRVPVSVRILPLTCSIGFCIAVLCGIMPWKILDFISFYIGSSFPLVFSLNKNAASYMWHLLVLPPFFVVLYRGNVLVF